MLVGERPGYQEARSGYPFLGPAGEELWDRFARLSCPPREQWYVTNLVKSFSTDPPSPRDVLLWAGELRTELRDCDPEFVVSVGAHATRWFLGPDTDMGVVHGKMQLSKRNGGVFVMPIYHPAAALRQPKLYQNVFTEDVKAVAAACVKTWEYTKPKPPAYTHGDWPDAVTLGCDTEGNWDNTETQCISISDGYVACLLSPGADGARFRRFSKGRRLVFHGATHDITALARCQIDIVDGSEFDDTMLMAYLLGEFDKGLKPLASRECGMQLNDYQTLIGELDNHNVRRTLETFYAQKPPKPKSKAKSAKPARADQKAAARVRARGAHVVAPVPPRAYTSANGVLTKDADKTLRERWEGSKFVDCCPLPPRPTWKDLPFHIGEPYALGDAVGHRRLFDVLKPRLTAADLMPAYRIDKAVLPMVARMERIGMRVDAKVLTRLSHQLEHDYETLCDELENVLGYRLNPKASEDVSEALFDDLGVTPTKLTKSGKHYTTGDKYLEARKAEHEAVPLVIRGRELWKLKSSYCDRLPTLLRDGRYFPDFNYIGTASGRLAETIILLIPKHSVEGQIIRTAFVADDGHRLVSIDLSQIELRVLAHLSHDEAMIAAFESGIDFHAQTAYELLGAPKKKEDQDESKHRLPAKKGNFGAFMGLSPKGLTEQIRAGGNVSWAVGCPVCDDETEPWEEHPQDCDSRVFFREYFKKYRGVKDYIRSRHLEAKRTGGVRTMHGRMIRCNGVWSTSKGVVAESRRMAQATTVQSGADELAKIWMADVWREIVLPLQRDDVYCEPWCRVHDDLILEVDEHHARSVARHVLKLVPQKLCIRTDAEAKTGYDWGSLEKL